MQPTTTLSPREIPLTPFAKGGTGGGEFMARRQAAPRRVGGTKCNPPFGGAGGSGTPGDPMFLDRPTAFCYSLICQQAGNTVHGPEWSEAGLTVVHITSGDIAQQGERCVRIAEVGGSNPPISTIVDIRGHRLVNAERAPVAQRIEQRFPKPRVGRSSRPRGTRFVGAFG